MKSKALENLLQDIKNQASPNLLQLQMLILNAELIDTLTGCEPHSSANIGKVVGVLEDYLEIYKKVATLDSSLVNDMYSKEQVQDIEDKFTVLMSQVNQSMFNQKPGEA